jgi:stage II sporulation protein D
VVKKLAINSNIKLFNFLKLVFVQIVLLLFGFCAQAQVRVRLFANQQSGSALFTVTEGRYELDVHDNKPIPLSKDDAVVFAYINGKVAVKTVNQQSFLCDSLVVSGMTGKDGFSLRITGRTSARHYYDGNLQCLPDLGKLVLVNICSIESYIAGVVRAEGGPGKNIEYLKSQALLVRSYLYKYLHRHVLDRYNMCDNVHCQAFNGVTADSLIHRAVTETHGLVVLDNDSIIISPAFHSNCGGETSVSQDVWLSGHSYLKKVIDPYCTASRNAKWTRSLKLTEWKEYLGKSGFSQNPGDPSAYNFSQITRLPDYRIGSFSLPFTKIRNDMGLPSAFFSITANNGSVTLKGRGNGHGVGLCQEGAMVMASKGFKFKQIIDFYFSDVIITDIRNVKKEMNNF